MCTHHQSPESMRAKQAKKSSLPMVGGAMMVVLFSNLEPLELETAVNTVSRTFLIF